MANPMKAVKAIARVVGGIANGGANRYVNPIYRLNQSSAKKQVAGYTAGLGATTAWIGSEVYESEKRRKKIKRNK